VTIKHMRVKSGRGATTEDFGSEAGSKMLQEVAHLVTNIIPANEAILVFTFKPKPSWNKQGGWRPAVDFEKCIRDAVKQMGGDPDVNIIVGDAIKPRLTVVTWGNETSVSTHAHCSHVIFAGVMFRNHLDIASHLISQKDNLFAPVDQKLIATTMQSEAAHCLYQAIMRTIARMVEVVDGKTMAKKGTAWLPYPDDSIKGWLDTVMPDAKWQKWHGTYLTEPEPSKQSELADIVTKALEKWRLNEAARANDWGIDDDTDTEPLRITVRDLWKLCPQFAGYSSRTRERTMKELLEDPCGNFQWRREGRSLIFSPLFEPVADDELLEAA
jgi:hypothetical protein